MTRVETNSNLSQRYEELAEDFFMSEAQNQIQLEPFILLGLNQDIIDFNSDLADLEHSIYQISLVAFKKDQRGGDRVHVKNFDTYTERDYVTIERWVTSLSNSQQEQLEDLQKQADRNNATAKNSFESLKQKLRTFLPDTSCLIEQKNVMSDFTQNSDIGGGLKEAINSDIEKLILQLNKLLDKIKSLNFEIDSWNISTPFNIKNTLKTIFQDVDNLSINLESFQETSSALRSLQSNIRDLTEGTKGCLNIFKAYFTNLRDTITLLKFQQSNYTASKEIGDEVKTFTLDNLPEKGFINLKGTGSRNNGD